jgi:PsbN protein
MFRNNIRIILFKLFQNMESATVLIITIGAFLIAVTGISIYTSFGPPSKELSDPFEDHED